MSARLGNVGGNTRKMISGDTKARDRTMEKEGGDGKEGGRKMEKRKGRQKDIIEAGVDWREARR